MHSDAASLLHWCKNSINHFNLTGLNLLNSNFGFLIFSELEKITACLNHIFIVFFSLIKLVKFMFAIFFLNKIIHTYNWILLQFELKYMKKNDLLFFRECLWNRLQFRKWILYQKQFQLEIKHAKICNKIKCLYKNPKDEEKNIDVLIVYCVQNWHEFWC